MQMLRKELDEAEAVRKRELQAGKEEAARNSGGVMSVEDQKAMAQLKKENQLMSSAWLDLNSRLQRENVVLNRRRESPKSWLGKQRAAVGLGVSGMAGR